jgi:hypothetical protein
MKASKFTDAQKAFVITQGEEQRLWHPAAQARVATSEQADPATLLPKCARLSPSSPRCVLPRTRAGAVIRPFHWKGPAAYPQNFQMGAF